ncbi:hypothetical protein B0H13DRAFT_819585 [Mycena leptocephala]|nr:hypothetical protein B0H13DRAFT_819585 [Mycena leptocephala]
MRTRCSFRNIMWSGGCASTWNAADTVSAGRSARPTSRKRLRGRSMSCGSSPVKCSQHATSSSPSCAELQGSVSRPIHAKGGGFGSARPVVCRCRGPSRRPATDQHPTDAIQMMIGAGGVVLTAPINVSASAGDPASQNLFRIYLNVPDTPPRAIHVL